MQGHGMAHAALPPASAASRSRAGACHSESRRWAYTSTLLSSAIMRECASPAVLVRELENSRPAMAPQLGQQALAPDALVAQAEGAVSALLIEHTPEPGFDQLAQGASLLPRQRPRLAQDRVGYLDGRLHMGTHIT